MSIKDTEAELAEFRAIRRLLNEDRPTHEMQAGSCVAVLFLELRQLNQTLGRIADAVELQKESP